VCKPNVNLKNAGFGKAIINYTLLIVPQKYYNFSEAQTYTEILDVGCCMNKYTY